ncbi:MAG: DUF6569 family protein [Syntrophobacteraceae bacterium]|jgi:hypothetical protein
MSVLQEVIPSSISLGNLKRVKGLGVIPILTEEVIEIPAFETLETALKKGFARITETGPGGEVPFLLFENTSDNPVIILDGEEVVGGKQNRIVNATLVILGNATVKIPVSCIQAGRWRRERADFESAGSVFRARSRAVHKATVTANVHESGSFRSDQNAVWNEVSESLHELGVESSTSDFLEGRERVAHRLEEFVEAIRPAKNQIGAIYLDTHGILGLEMLGSPVLFAKDCDKVTRSFAFEILNAPDLNRASAEAAKKWWHRVLEAGFTLYASPGAGEDIRVAAEDLIGSGLIWDGVVVHFSCFPNMRRQSQRRASAGQRRRNLL